jgi:hypothetical protein
MASIAGDLRLRDLPSNELESIIGALLPHGRLDPGSSEVVYSVDQLGECALSLLYDDGLLVDVQTGPAFSDELHRQLLEQVETFLLVDEGTVVRRDIWFSLPKIEGYWRHSDALQLLPAPSDAPGVPYVMGQHPFVLEARVRQSSNPSIAIGRAAERLRELHLVLSLVCMGRVSRTSPSVQHHWAIVWDPTDGDASNAETRYVQEGYSLPGFVVTQDDFTPVVGIEPLDVLPTDEYFGQLGIGTETTFDVPDCLPLVLDNLDAVDASVRERFLRACYWLDQSGQVWSHSRSLSYLATITAIETLALHPPEAADPCPTCGKDRAPGPTRRFKAFVERFAGSLPSKERAALYSLRSQLAHGHDLLATDKRLWRMGLDPLDVQQMDLHRVSTQVARVVIIGWFLAAEIGPIGHVQRSD